MNPDELEDLLRQLVQSISEVMQSGEQLSDEFQGLLADTLAKLVDRIDQARSQQQPEAPTTPPQQAQINEAMPSSNVEGFAYDDKTGRLLVRFLGKHPDRNGPIYSYDNVPENVFDIFRRGAIPAKTNGRNKWGEWWQGKYPSMGAAMYHLIRAGGYSYRRVA